MSRLIKPNSPIFYASVFVRIAGVLLKTDFPSFNHRVFWNWQFLMVFGFFGKKKVILVLTKRCHQNSPQKDKKPSKKAIGLSGAVIEYMISKRHMYIFYFILM